MTCTIRSLETLEDCRQVVSLEKQVWGYTDAEDVVPTAILLVSIKRGGILLGAFEGSRMVGFVYSLAAIKDGQLTQWSHMLGVLPEARRGGTGIRLKLAQRDAALAMGITLIEWTFDPMQALNAHLNFARLGVVAEDYIENLYGDSSSPLHQGTPTDRLIAQWRLDAPHVARRIGRCGLTLRDAGTYDARTALAVVERGGRKEPGELEIGLEDRRVAVEIPVGFLEVMAADAALAQEWRMATRRVFRSYFARGYRAVDFFLDRARGKGRYLLGIPAAVD